MRNPTTPRLSAVAALFAACYLASFPAARAQGLSAAVQPQADSLQAEKASRTPAQQKIDSQLVFTIKKHRGEKLGVGLDELEKGIKVAADGFEVLDIRAKVTPALIADLEARGAKIIAAVPRFSEVRARVPLAQVEAIAARADVLWVRKAVGAHTNVGAVNSQGDATHRANTVRATLAATGRGVKVGVLSDSVDSLTTSQSTLDLGPVTVLPGQSGLGGGNSGEGTAMLEIVHDLAPDAELFFASAFISEAQFAQNILDLRAAGCDIIVDDVGYFDESPLQDGPVAQAVNEIVASGGLYFSSAGNEGNKNDGTSGTWEGDFVDGGPTGPIFGKVGRLHNFGTDNFNTLVTNGSGANLFWADPAGASTNDYDLYVLDATGSTILAASTNIQNGHQDPYEITGTGAGLRLVIVKSASAQPRFLHLGTLRGTLSQSTSGTVVGHPAAAGAFAVAATSALVSSPNPFVGGATNPVETFSTDGDRRVFFEADGTPITPGNFSATGGLLRQKPEITAADGTSCTVPGFTPFYGTSAAAPHAAAIAALVWSRNRALTPQQVRTALISTAIDIEGPGIDRDSGVGIVDALAAAQSVAGGAIITSTGPTVTGESYTPPNSVFDPGEVITVSLPLINSGAGAAGNLVATLLNTGGVTNASAPQSYGALAPAANASRTFTFTVGAAAGSSVNLAFRLTDGAAYLGTVTATFSVGVLGVPINFTNAVATSIPSSGVATPYPSTLSVAGVTGPIGRVTATLTGFTHTYPADVNVVLVSPAGQKVMLMAAAGGSADVSAINLTFDDTAAATLGTVLTTGTFRPTTNGQEAVSITAPAPGAPYQTTLGAFSGSVANGTWSLYVVDTAAPDAGSIASWKLAITPVTTQNSGPNADLATTLTQSSDTLAPGEPVTFTATVTNVGAATANSVVLTDTLPATLAFNNATTSLGTVANIGNAVTATIGTLASGQSATVTMTAGALTAGATPNTATAALTGTETILANNSASVNVTVGQPNLAPTQVVVSTVQGTSVDAPTIAPNDPVFLDLTIANNGTSPTRTYFVSELYVDGVLRRTFEQQLPLAAGASDPQLDVALGTFGPGTHTVLFKTDTLGAVPESSEADNSFTRTFTVQGPNLAPFKRAGASDKIVVSKGTGTSTDSPSLNSTDSIYVDYGIINNGTLVTGVSTQAQLFLDDVLIAGGNASATLAPGEDTGVTDILLVNPTAGVHMLRLVVDSGSTLAETNEADNEAVKTFVINSVPTITAIQPQTIAEDSGLPPTSFTVGDGETAASDLTVTKTSSNPAVVLTDAILLAGTGANRTVSLAASPNASGTSTITLTVSDGNGGSASTSFLVTVLSVNDAPSFTPGPNIQVAQDSGPQTFAGWATAIDKGGPEESGQTLIFAVGATHQELFTTVPAISPSGTLTFTPAPGASGSTEVTIHLQDNGGTANGGAFASGEFIFSIAISTYAEELGTYNGLALPAIGATPGVEKTGLLKVTVGKLGKLTGKLVLGAFKWSINGTVDKLGAVKFGKLGATTLALPRKGLTPLTLALQLDVSGGSDKITGVVTDGVAPFAVLDGDRALYTSKDPAVAPFLVTPPALVGKYTLAFFALPEPNGGLAAEKYPQGDGVGTLVVDKKGNAKITATLADGTKISYANALSKGNFWPLFVALNKGTGSIAGPVKFLHIASASDFAGTGLHWFKAAGAVVYPDGWPGGIQTNLVGSLYNPPDAAAIVPGLTAADANGNARFSLEQGGIVNPLGLVKALGITDDNKVSVITAAADELSLKLNTGTGLFSGSFIHPATSAKVKIQGAILRESSVGVGFFTGADSVGSATLEPNANP